MSDTGFDPQTLYVDGFDSLRKAFDQAPQTAMPIVVKAMDKAALAIIGEVKGYPPVTAANAPGRTHIIKVGGIPREVPMGYYERGRGWWEPITTNSRRGAQIAFLKQRKGTRGVFGKTRGILLSKNVNNVVGYKLRGSSEELGRSWAHKTEMEGSEIVTSVGNNASYVDYVNGPKSRQNALMGMRGWEAIDDGLDKSIPDLDAIYSDAADEIVAAIARK